MKRLTTLLLFCVAFAAQAETAITNKSTELQSQARADASTVATLPENTKVEVLRRQGAWREVKAGGQTGWVSMFNLKLEASAGAPAPAASSGNLLTPRNSNNPQVGTVARGLTKEDLQNAQANPVEFQKMQKYAVNKSAAQSFATRAKLSTVQLDYLPATAPARTETTSFNGG